MSWKLLDSNDPTQGYQNTRWNNSLDKTLEVSPQTDDLIPVSYLAYRDNSFNRLPESMFNKAPFVFTGYDRENIGYKDDYQLGYTTYSKNGNVTIVDHSNNSFYWKIFLIMFMISVVVIFLVRLVIVFLPKTYQYYYG